MKRILASLTAAMVLAACTTISPGHVGILVNKFGTNRGVQDYTITTGFVSYNPFSTSVLEWPTSVQTVVWTQNPNEGRKQDESFTFNSKDGLVISADVSLSYSMMAAKIPHFYVQFRTDDMDQFTYGYLHNVARDAFNEVAARYDVDELYGPKKEEFIDTVKARINQTVDSLGVNINQFGFIGSLRLPEMVTQALNAKIEATQLALKAQNQLVQRKFEADQKVATARGEAQANQLLAQSLNSTLIEWRRLEIQKQAVDKWNGTLPTYSGGGAIPFIQLQQGQH